MGKDDNSVKFVVLRQHETAWPGENQRMEVGSDQKTGCIWFSGHLQREWLYHGMKHIDACDQNYILKDPCL